MATPEAAAHRLHGPAAELFRMLKAHGAGLISREELLDWVYNLLHLYPDLFNQDPHALHLYAMACEEFGWADKAISAYAESAVQLSLIEDPIREAAAYTALARQHYDCGDIDSASRAASQAMFLYLHVRDIPKLAVHRLYDFCLRTAKTQSGILTTPRMDRITTSISHYARTATTLYTC